MRALEPRPLPGALLRPAAGEPGARHRAAWLALAALAAALWLGPATGVAQESPAPPPETQAPEAGKPAAIPPPDVPARAEAASERLRAISERLAPDPAISEVQQQLPEARESLQALLARSRRDDLGQFTFRELADLGQELLRWEGQLDRWQQALRSRSDALQEAEEAVDQLQTVWELTRDASTGELGRVLDERVRSVLAEIAAVRRALTARLEAVLALQDTLSSAQISISEGIASVEAAEQAARGALIRLDSPPLWRALVADGEDVSLREQLGAAAAQLRLALADLLEAYPVALLLHLIVFGALAVLIELMRRRTRQWPLEDPELRASVHVMSHPVSSALLIALLMTTWFYPRAGTSVYDVAEVILLLPLLRLLPGLVFESLRRPLFALAGLYLLVQVHTLGSELTSLARLLLFVINLLALAGLALVLRPGSPIATVSASGWWRAAVVAGWVAIPLLAVALLANLVGNVSLAELLTGGALNSAFAAVGLLAGYIVLTSLLPIVLRTRYARGLRMVNVHGALVARRLGSLLRVAALLLWIYATASFFRLLDPVWNAVADALGHRWSIGSVDLSVGDVVAFFAAIYLAVVLSRLVRFALEEDVLPRLALPRGIPRTVSMMVHYAIITLGFLLAVGAAGFDLTRLTIIAGALSVGVGFGLQNVVNNFVSGLILAFERPVQVGDVIEFETLFGEVKRIGIRSSTVRTFQGAEVIVPNGDLISSKVINWTLTDRLRRVEVEVGVAYGTEPQRVLDLLVRTAERHQDILDEPAPFALFRGFGDSSLDFSLLCWTANFDRFLKIRSELTVAVHDALAEAGIEIPFPQRDLHLRSVDPHARLSVTSASAPQSPPAGES